MNCPTCGHDNIPGQDLCEHCGLDLAGLDVAAWGVDPDDPILTMPLSELALKEPLVLAPGEPVIRAIEMMKQRKEGCVFILDEGELVGVLTVVHVTQYQGEPIWFVERKFCFAGSASGGTWALLNRLQKEGRLASFGLQGVEADIRTVLRCMDAGTHTALRRCSSIPPSICPQCHRCPGGCRCAPGGCR